MNDSSRTWPFALSIAEDALTWLGDRRHGPVLYRLASQVDEVLREWQWRARTEHDRSRWLECVRISALQMVWSGQLPGGARLSMLSDRRFAGW